MALRVTEMDSLEVGIVAGMEDSLENETRSIDDLRMGIFKMLQNVCGEGCESSSAHAEDAQH